MKRDRNDKELMEWPQEEVSESLAVSVVETESEGSSQNSILQLQLTMATNSINHEYARIEFEDSFDAERREDLLEYMAGCRSKYFEARQSLVVHDPNAVQEFEADLIRQKIETLGKYNA